MSLASAWSVALLGVDGVLVEIEADIGAGLPGLQLVGLPDAALSEARDRIRAAVLNSEESWPSRRMTLALSPATLPKVGSGYDVANVKLVHLSCRHEPARRHLRPHLPRQGWRWPRCRASGHGLPRAGPAARLGRRQRALGQ